MLPWNLGVCVFPTDFSVFWICWEEGEKCCWIRAWIWNGSKSNPYYLGKVERQTKKTRYLNQFSGEVSGKGQAHKWKKQSKNQILRRVRKDHSKRWQRGKEQFRTASLEGLWLIWSYDQTLAVFECILCCIFLKNGLCQEWARVDSDWLMQFLEIMHADY